MLSTLITPDGGSAKVLGIDVAHEPEKVREVIGLAGQYAALDEFQTGYENVYMTGLLYGLSRAEAKKRAHELLERLDLVEAANRPVRTYSGGMQRRLDLGASLVGEPKVLYLDEPTTGLDPRSRQDIWQIVRELVAGGTSILLTTQYLEEADELADRIAVMNEGRVVAEGTSDQLKDQLGGDVVEFELANKSQRSAAGHAVTRFASARPTYDQATGRVRVPVKEGSRSLMGIVQALSQSRVGVNSLSLHRPSLDDVFLALTGHKAEASTVETPAAAKPAKRRQP